MLVLTVDETICLYYMPNIMIYIFILALTVVHTISLYLKEVDRALSLREV